MVHKSLRALNRFSLKYRMLIALILTFFLIMFTPYLQTHYPQLPVLLEIIFNIGLVLVIHSSSTENRNIVLASTLLGTLAIVFMFFESRVQSINILLAGLFLEVLLMTITIITTMRFVLFYKKLTDEKIYGAMFVYLLLGAVWTLIYSIIEIHSPNSFRFSSGFTITSTDVNIHRFYFAQFLSFSLGTLCTLAFGDIAPISYQARIIATLEAIVGQLYIAVLIARLVGASIGQSIMENKEHK